jgi:biotin/methionine sulfoxide reductase
MNENRPKRISTLSHWGAYELVVNDDQIVRADPGPDDADPSPIGRSIPGAVHHRSRVSQPMARKGWLERGGERGAGGRGSDPFVPVSWDQALDLAARELDRIRTRYGNDAIFGGSYGWASAGRFHHCQSQVHRFLNCFGGYVRSVDSYSSAAARVILPHVIGWSSLDFQRWGASWDIVADACELMVMFGGAPMRNAQVEQGGPNRHVLKEALVSCKKAGVEFVNISPLRDDAADFLDAQWLTPRPNSDTALMLAIAYWLIEQGRHDEVFLASHCVGFERFRDYVVGAEDGVAKTPAWAATITGLEAGAIADLARRMADKRTMITMSLSLQRAQYGEQPFWMAVTLAAMLGGIGAPGRGIGFSVGAFNNTGRSSAKYGGPTLPQGQNAVDDFIPVARIVDMLEKPGTQFDYNGQKRSYPDIRLIYWCGGNPFHHHQDLNRLIAAWQKPDTIIVHEPWWTAAAKHADLVLPATTPYERNDIGYSFNDDTMSAMKQAIAPLGEARNDYDIFAAISQRLGFADAFTEGRSVEQWLRRLYDDFRQRTGAEGDDLPDFDEFWTTGRVRVPMHGSNIPFSDFRADPDSHPLKTASGKIEIYSDTIAGFYYDDCPPHASWLEPDEWLGSELTSRYPLHMTSPQPMARLHSQLDCGEFSLENKVAGREPVMINPADAAARGIRDGDLVRVFNDRGACLAGAVVDDGVMQGVVALATGAWYDADAAGELERHGNPNVLTRDVGTSRLAQGCSAHTALVDVALFDGPAPLLKAHEPPKIGD